jgi:hypothetical protein
LDVNAEAGFPGVDALGWVLAESGMAGLDWKTQGADIGLVIVRRSVQL